MTQAEAVTQLKEDIKSRGETAVQSKIAVKLSQNEYDALSIFNFNTNGIDAKSSTIRTDINAGVTDKDKISADFGMWNEGTINGIKQVIDGLTRRRAAEAGIYTNNTYIAP